ncbi:MAG: T4 RnlA family RNA ligase [bacterium]
MKLEIQKYLLTHSVQELEDEYSIIAKQHSIYPNLFLFKYSQIDSPMDNPIVQESRGLILDMNKDWSIVNMTYKKFFNYKEPNAVCIDWNSAKVMEKLDGSLINLWYYDNQWHVSTSGSPSANGSVYNNQEDYGFTFKELFWQVWNEKNYRLPTEEKLCFAFELITPYNQVVVRHKRCNIILHGVRNRETLDEYEPQLFANKYNWQCVKCYNFNCLDDVIKNCEDIDPLKQEGYVVCDNKFNRVKVKSPKYVLIHHMRDVLCADKKMLLLIQKNETSEFLTYFPYLKEKFDTLKRKYIILIHEIEKTYSKVCNIENKKDFALEVKDLFYSDCLFKMHSNKIKSAKEYLSECRVSQLEKLINNIKIGM